MSNFEYRYLDSTLMSQSGTFDYISINSMKNSQKIRATYLDKIYPIDPWNSVASQ